MLKLDLAIVGTTGILRAVIKSAPTVKKVVITSSFASIVDGDKGSRPGYKYSEQDWNPVTLKEAVESPSKGYRGKYPFSNSITYFTTNTVFNIVRY